MTPTLETYYTNDAGYHPFLIRDGWQVAQLNADNNQLVENITRLDVHYQTDEAFILTKGKAVLITADMIEQIPHYKLALMQLGVTYNVPVDTWHNIAMETGAEVIIVEKDNTHLGDFEFFDLSAERKEELVNKVNEIFQKEA